VQILLAPIDPPVGGRCWSVSVVNDGPSPIGVVEVVSVDYEWGDAGNEERVGTRVGPIAPGETREIYRETDTELRTSLTLRVDGKPWYAELGKLYGSKGRPARTIVPTALGGD
jgi:hypothetical protein